MPLEKSAGAIIFRKEKNKIYYLLLHYESGHWGFAKGHIENGEEEIKTVERETEEETGIKTLKIIKGFREEIKYFFRNNYGLSDKEKKKVPWTFKIVVFYLAETRTKEIKISREHLDYKWLSFEKALEQLTYKNAKELLKKANDYVKSREEFKKYEKKKGFREKVLEVVKKIPRGQTLNYKKVAEKAGSPKAWRAAGNILNKNKNSGIPCHRVIRSDGKAGGYNKGERKKILLLKKEGVKLKTPPKRSF